MGSAFRGQQNPWQSDIQQHGWRQQRAPGGSVFSLYIRQRRHPLKRTVQSGLFGIVCQIWSSLSTARHGGRWQDARVPPPSQTSRRGWRANSLHRKLAHLPRPAPHRHLRRYPRRRKGSRGKIHLVRDHAAVQEHRPACGRPPLDGCSSGSGILEAASEDKKWCSDCLRLLPERVARAVRCLQ